MAVGPDRMPLPPRELMTPAQREAVEEISAGPRGDVIGPFVPLLRSPELMTRLQRTGEYLRFHKVLPTRLFEMCILMVARRWNQQFEWSFHHPIAIEAGLEPSIVAALALGRRPDGMDRVLAAGWDLLDELHRTAAVSDEAYGRALDVLGDQAVVELVAAAGYYTTLAMVMNTARTPAPAEPALPDLATSRNGVAAGASGAILARDGSGVPILLLHALGVDRRLWDRLTGLLPGRPLLTYDFPGHGQAPVPEEPFTIHDLAEQLVGALRAGGWTRVHVLGVSLGGLVAQDLAAHHPELVERLVLVDTVAHYPDEQVGRWHERAALARASGMAPIADTTMGTWFTAGFLAEDGPQIRDVRVMFTTTDPHGYALTCEALAGADTRKLVSRIRARTLVVCGDDDMPAFRDAARWLAATIPQAELCWLAPARHLGILELPHPFADRLRTFLDAT